MPYGNQLPCVAHISEGDGMIQILMKFEKLSWASTLAPWGSMIWWKSKRTCFGISNTFQLTTVQDDMSRYFLILLNSETEIHFDFETENSVILFSPVMTGTNVKLYRIQQSQICSTAHVIKADSKSAPSQWGKALLCYDVSHWLCANLESALIMKMQMKPN